MKQSFDRGDVVKVCGKEAVGTIVWAEPRAVLVDFDDGTMSWFAPWELIPVPSFDPKAQTNAARGSTSPRA